MSRSDAQANRAKILVVAEEVFGAGGEGASTEEVARRAGVGIATVFRHYPTKAALLEAVLTERFTRLAGRAKAEAGAQDPGRAFFDFFAYMVADSASKIAIAEALAEAGGALDGPAAVASRELHDTVGVLLAQAQAAGAVRTDVDLPEVYALLIGASRAAYAGVGPEVRDRSLKIIFDGLATRP
ncbi:TetR/AcrR family transcriptional regulator [Hamadaea tsunoensis]|uniref:TetR/AcrR family transcriptional regulator n=1 Tax=Hamadaea tsunoensis TaxID=53368 RepID=UPI00040777AF|nr:helix-turn-helix domain-containing protein [Hamadaea tsunoensis]